MPLTIVSPWSRGGWVNSELFDHSSVIRFLERRFGVEEPNISPWRRSVCGDLTSAFDFRSPNHRSPLVLPGTTETAARAARLGVRPAAAPPPHPDIPRQEPGIRRSRALGYALDVQPEVGSDHVRLAFANAGRLGAVVHVYNRLDLGRTPRRYTVAAGETLDGIWPLAPDGGYDLWMIGPNGFHRHVAGKAGDAVDWVAKVDMRDLAMLLTVTNSGTTPKRMMLRTMAYGGASRTIEVAAGRSVSERRPLASTHGWYDFALTSSRDDGFVRRLAGRVETGRDGVSDPAMGGAAVISLPV
jgi:phospholipase C